MFSCHVDFTNTRANNRRVISVCVGLMWMKVWKVNMCKWKSYDNFGYQNFGLDAIVSEFVKIILFG